MTTRFQRRQEIVMERLDDIPLLISLQQRLGLDDVIDEAVDRHWLHQGLPLRQLVIGWIPYILRTYALQSIVARFIGIGNREIADFPSYRAPRPPVVNRRTTRLSWRYTVKETT